MDRLRSMAVFVRAVEAGSFRAASAGLGMTPQMVGTHVRALEERLGVRLLHRTTREQGLTAAGRSFLDRCRVALDAVAAAEAVGGEHAEVPRGLLRVSAPAVFGTVAVAPVVAGFLLEWPEAEVALELSDRPANLVDGSCDVAVRVGPLADSGLLARKLAPYRLIACAAPDYLARRGMPLMPDEVGAHECLVYVGAAGAPWASWVLERDGRVDTVRARGRLRSTDVRAVAEAARAGLGLAMLPEALVRADLEAGRLVPVLDGWRSPERDVHLLFAPDRGGTALRRAFTAAVVAALG
ncbi:MAG: LysR family transcriptional regulator [Gluconacetobacter diazotrophicus]|nr:LysR family transcriptional regulator [Gluconacetobacter diazotrophicus]